MLYDKVTPENTLLTPCLSFLSFFPAEVERKIEHAGNQRNESMAWGQTESD
jgi:hypothetical protein